MRDLLNRVDAENNVNSEFVREIVNHGMTQRPLTKLAIAEVQNELERNMVAPLNTRAIAYPFGDGKASRRVCKTLLERDRKRKG